MNTQIVNRANGKIVGWISIFYALSKQFADLLYFKTLFKKFITTISSSLLPNIALLLHSLYVLQEINAIKPAALGKEEMR